MENKVHFEKAFFEIWDNCLGKSNGGCKLAYIYDEKFAGESIMQKGATVFYSNLLTAEKHSRRHFPNCSCFESVYFFRVVVDERDRPG